jgi:uncharacterized lipoprotein YajG
MRNSYFLKILFLLTSLFVFSACSSSPKAPQINPTEGAQMLAGVYTTSISSEDVSKMESLDPTLPNNQGEWKITFTNDGKFDAQKDDQFMAGGLFAVKNNEIEIYVKQVCTNCGCQDNIGRFSWAQKDDRLAFSYLAGVCDTMKLVLTAHAITRQP